MCVCVHVSGWKSERNRQKYINLSVGRQHRPIWDWKKSWGESGLFPSHWDTHTETVNHSHLHLMSIQTSPDVLQWWEQIGVTRDKRQSHTVIWSSINSSFDSLCFVFLRGIFMETPFLLFLTILSKCQVCSVMSTRAQWCYQFSQHKKSLPLSFFFSIIFFFNYIKKCFFFGKDCYSNST